MLLADWIERLAEADKVTRNKVCALVDQLEERVLAVCAWLAPVNRSGRIVHARAFERDVLAIALHCQLLKVARWMCAGAKATALVRSPICLDRRESSCARGGRRRAERRRRSRDGPTRPSAGRFAGRGRRRKSSSRASRWSCWWRRGGRWPPPPTDHRGGKRRQA